MDYDTHKRIAEEAYEETPSESVGDYRLVHSTPTLKAYRDSNNHLIVGVRGTYDKRDVKTDASLAIGRLKRTQRFKDDKRALADVLQRYQGSVTTASHSLGGAIADELTKEHRDRITGGIAFNPAYDARQLHSGGHKGITRYYTRGDALSKLGGKRLHNVKWVDSGDKDFIDAHRLDNF